MSALRYLSISFPIERAVRAHHLSAAVSTQPVATRTPLLNRPQKTAGAHAPGITGAEEARAHP